MKKIKLIIVFVLFSKMLISQVNTTKGIIFFLPLPTTCFVTSISQERFIKENLSIEITERYLKYTGDISQFYSLSTIIGSRIYLNSKKNILRKYWVNPNISWRYFINVNDDYKVDYYNMGASIGLRKYMKNEKLFLDFGFGISYSIGIYRNYISYSYLEPEKIIQVGHENEYFFYPRFILNMGYKY